MRQQLKRTRLTSTRATIATLLVGALTISPTADAAPYAPRCHFTCAERCDWERCYDRCMYRCRNEYSSRPRPRWVSPAERHRQGTLVELILRFLAELGSGELLTAVVFAVLAWVTRTIRRCHNLWRAMECERQANAHDHVAANLRAEADRLKHDL